MRNIVPRSANHTILGFLYQFNKTALEILKAQNDDVITVEGIAEDIEVESPTSLTAIQCKYHEASGSFTPSMVYKPLLQMLRHFSEHNTANIKYILFAHFSNTSELSSTVDKTALEKALSSKDKELRKHIDAVPRDIDLDDFLRHFEMKAGPSYDKITKELVKELENNGFSTTDIDTLAYPNAIQLIATLSVKHALSERKVTKKEFLSDLNSIRTTAISRWTLALKTRSKLLQARRKQLKTNLDKNARRRYFVIDPSHIDDYDAEIIIFLRDYTDKYHFKYSHTDTPVLCVKRKQIQDIRHRLYKKGIRAIDGYIGEHFEENLFFRTPMINKVSGSKYEYEFSFRILNWDDHSKILNSRKCDDLFVIGEPNIDSIDTTDVNVEIIEGATMKEIKYVLGLSDVYE